MKTLFVALSSSYIHTLLAPRYLAENSPIPVEILETNVNINIEETIKKIIDKNPDIVAFSCYIFNFQIIKKLCISLKKIKPEITIILGGYEVETNPENFLDIADYIIIGEGDFSFGELLQKIENKEKDIPKIVYSEPICDLDTIKSPLTDEYLELCKINEIIDFESSRGCPFKCSYCMSSNSKGVRFFSLNRVFSELLKIKHFSPPLVKFVDRTFNTNLDKSLKIFEFIYDNFKDENTRFHFEMSPDLFNDIIFKFLEKIPEGLFQFEIGIQSYNTDVLNNINRHTNLDVVDNNLRRLIDLKNIPIHVDLIAGLPDENINSFISGFNHLIAFKPNCLQLGFLKILPGSPISKNCKGYVFDPNPPYEIKSSPALSTDDVLLLKNVEYMLNVYYNSGRFTKSISYLFDIYKSPFDLFLDIYNFFIEKQIEKQKFEPYQQCDLLYEFATRFLDEKQLKTLEKHIYFDYISSGNIRRWHRWMKKSFE